MQYEKKDGKIIGNLPKPSIDTGAGLERLAMVLQGVDNIYDTDLLRNLMLVAASMSGNNLKACRIISDHIRSAVFLVADGVIPSNTGRGYILRRLIRRAIFNIWNKHVDKKEIATFVEILGNNTYSDIYKNISLQKDTIIDVIFSESEQFEKTIHNGLKEFEKMVSSNDNDLISGKDAFILFSTYGFPLEMTKELAKERSIEVDEVEFSREFKAHQALSRAGAEQKFKGGLADANDPMVVRYHTATHLLHQALRDVLGDGVGQKGSNITPERLRFDFSYGAKMTDEEKKRVEDIVNEKIAEKLPVNKMVLPKAEAEKTSARHFFGEKYGDEVSIYFIGKASNPPTIDDINNAYSKEFCGGPHVKNTGELAGPEGLPAASPADRQGQAGKWKFKIKKEEAVSQGVRRIKAVLG
jgi:alanyl-tRNA synthetase